MATIRHSPYAKKVMTISSANSDSNSALDLFTIPTATVKEALKKGKALSSANSDSSSALDLFTIPTTTVSQALKKGKALSSANCDKDSISSLSKVPGATVAGRASITKIGKSISSSNPDCGNSFSIPHLAASDQTSRVNKVKTITSAHSGRESHSSLSRQVETVGNKSRLPSSINNDRKLDVKSTKEAVKDRTIVAKPNAMDISKMVISDSAGVCADDQSVRKSSRKRKLNSSYTRGDFMLAKDGLRNLFNVFGVDSDDKPSIAAPVLPENCFKKPKSLKKHLPTQNSSDKYKIKSSVKSVDDKKKSSASEKDSVRKQSKFIKVIPATKHTAKVGRPRKFQLKSATVPNHKSKPKVLQHHKLKSDQKHAKKPEMEGKLQTNANLSKEAKVERSTAGIDKEQLPVPKQEKSSSAVIQQDAKLLRSNLLATAVKSPVKDRSKLLADIQRKKLVEKSKMISNQQLTKLQKGNLRPRMVRQDVRIVAASTLKLSKKARRFRGRKKRQRRNSDTSWDSSSDDSDGSSSNESDSDSAASRSDDEDVETERDNGVSSAFKAKTNRIGDDIYKMIVDDGSKSASEETDSESAVEVDIDTTNTDDILNPLRVPFKPDVLADALNPACRDRFVLINDNSTNWNDVAAEMPSAVPGIDERAKIDQPSIRLLRSAYDRRRPKLFIDNFNPQELAPSSTCTCYVSFTETDDGAIVCHVDNSDVDGCNNKVKSKTRTKKATAVDNELNQLDPSDHFIAIPIVDESDLRNNTDFFSLNFDFETSSSFASQFDCDDAENVSDHGVAATIDDESIACDICSRGANQTGRLCECINSAKKKREIFSEQTVKDEFQNDAAETSNNELSRIQTRPKRMKSCRMSSDYYYYDGASFGSQSSVSSAGSCATDQSIITKSEKSQETSLKAFSTKIDYDNDNVLVATRDYNSESVNNCSQSSSLTDLSTFVSKFVPHKVYSNDDDELSGSSILSNSSDNANSISAVNDEEPVVLYERIRRRNDDLSIVVCRERSGAWHPTPIQFASGLPPFIDHTYCYPPPAAALSRTAGCKLSRRGKFTSDNHKKCSSAAVAATAAGGKMSPIVTLYNIQSFLTVSRHLKRFASRELWNMPS
ncbi:uncharacterized protein LOC141914885 isoform X2 [Tubulanus polymorphus]|uniref:uncharacterized protein LOC141914885 isoform X2 n=1 Tax=Tubulanus polymorphus TaxID=672921 RepID=UPI003DA6C80A